MAALYIDAQAAHDILKHTMKQLRAKVHLPSVPLASNFEYNFERPPRYNLDGRTSVSEIAGFPVFHACGQRTAEQSAAKDFFIGSAPNR